MPTHSLPICDRELSNISDEARLMWIDWTLMRLGKASRELLTVRVPNGEKRWFASKQSQFINSQLMKAIEALIKAKDKLGEKNLLVGIKSRIELMYNKGYINKTINLLSFLDFVLKDNNTYSTCPTGGNVFYFYEAARVPFGAKATTPRPTLTS